MAAYPVLPGVPSAGHISPRGCWHPGSPDGCPKCEPATGLLFRCRTCHGWTDPDRNHECQPKENQQ